MNIKDKIPDGWEVFSFGNKELVNIIDGDRGKNYPKEKDFFDEGYCLFLNTKNVTNRGFNFNTNKYITKEKDNSLRSGKLNRYDIVMTTRGTIGNCGFYDDFVKYDNIRINSGMVIFRVISDKIFQKYLYMFLTSNIMREQILSCTTGTAQPQLPIWTINKLYFFLPPLSEQKRIASILSALDDKIELNNKTNKILEEMAQTIFKEWFINFNFPNEDGKPYKKSGGEMIDSELGKIPKGWKVITLKDIISIAKGKKPKATSDKITEKFTMPYLTINCYNNEATEYTEYNEKMHVKELDIVMVMDGNAGKIFYGKEGILSSTMAKLIVEDSNLNELVFYFLKSIEYDLMYHTVGSVIQHADKQYMLNKKFCVSLDNLERLSDIFKCIRKEISLNKKENEKLSNIRDSLLPKLMTPKGRRADGEIRV